MRSDEYPAVSSQEEKAVVKVCILAAFADGAQGELERAEVKRIAENFSSQHLDLTSLYQQALAGQASLRSITGELQSSNSKALAYEMALCICEADDALSQSEQSFLTELRDALGLNSAAVSEAGQAASSTREHPPIIAEVTSTAETKELDEMIRDRAILAGALELMPQRLATMAIVPVQMRMVYQGGKAFGYDLDLSHTKEFFATVGVGLASQVVDGYLSKLVGNVTRRFAGRFMGALASQATESAISFATTYALGQAAKTYYQSGRTLSAGQLRETFSKMLSEGQSMQQLYAGQIAQRAGSLKLADFVPLVKA